MRFVNCFVFTILALVMGSGCSSLKIRHSADYQPSPCFGDPFRAQHWESVTVASASTPSKAEIAFFEDPDSSSRGGPDIQLVTLHIPKQGPYIDSLRTEFFRHKNPDNTFWSREYPMFVDFYFSGSDRSIRIHESRPRLIYKTWLLEPDDPLVVIMPGLGSAYTSETLTAMAELFNRQGYSVVLISNAMNWLFYEAASSAVVPGYTPRDAEDIYLAIQKILAHLREAKALRPAKVLLAGYSLGALHTLFISDLDLKQKRVGFDKFIAINPPVDLLYGLKQLDEMFATWEAWDKASEASKAGNHLTLQQRLDKAAAVYFSLLGRDYPANAPIRMSSEEAKFLIGFSFHMMLQELIFSVQKRYDLAVVRTPYRWLSRQYLYWEIGHYGYLDYVSFFVKKYYSAVWQRPVTLDELNREAGLRSLEESLKTNPKIRVFHNQDDFLLRKEDRSWLRDTLGDRIVFFDRGGHLGNLYDWYVQQFIINSLLE